MEYFENSEGQKWSNEKNSEVCVGRSIAGGNVALVPRYHMITTL